ncbi:hypothetical protein OVY01_05150 [Robbsia sp. Bb-Pol-6]|uniref:Uncharacterized protein n=1 Tax=Robbsia betulipollinis TaxID=2981849 RepID=A0ABT3ZJC8_9BURK|nr:hypothetical protein [Robbsia betulipollinis]MCY0386633.1 hypothetical protein [Robbsia betulipollinis]
MGSANWQKHSPRRQGPQPKDENKTAARAEFDALFESPASQEAKRREADAQIRSAVIAEVRLQVERYAFQPAELGFDALSA